jgi:hypothetical protein
VAFLKRFVRWFCWFSAACWADIICRQIQQMLPVDKQWLHFEALAVVAVFYIGAEVGRRGVTITAPTSEGERPSVATDEP